MGAGGREKKSYLQNWGILSPSNSGKLGIWYWLMGRGRGGTFRGHRVQAQLAPTSHSHLKKDGDLLRNGGDCAEILIVRRRDSQEGGGGGHCDGGDGSYGRGPEGDKESRYRGVNHRRKRRRSGEEDEESEGDRHP